MKHWSRSTASTRARPHSEEHAPKRESRATRRTPTSPGDRDELRAGVLRRTGARHTLDDPRNPRHPWVNDHAQPPRGSRYANPRAVWTLRADLRAGDRAVARETSVGPDRGPSRTTVTVSRYAGKNNSEPVGRSAAENSDPGPMQVQAEHEEGYKCAVLIRLRPASLAALRLQTHRSTDAGRAPRCGATRRTTEQATRTYPRAILSPGRRPCHIVPARPAPDCGPVRQPSPGGVMTICLSKLRPPRVSRETRSHDGDHSRDLHTGALQAPSSLRVSVRSLSRRAWARRARPRPAPTPSRRTAGTS